MLSVISPEMEDSSRPNKPSLSRSSSRHKRSGYEPSDTETEWQEQESPWPGGLLISNRSKTPDPVRTINSMSNRSKTPGPTRTISPLNRSQRHISREDKDNSANKSSRRHSRSPYKPIRHDEDAASYMAQSGLRRNSSPFKALEHRNTGPYKVSEHRNTSPYKVSEQHHTSPYKVLEHRSTSPFKVSENRNTSPFKVSEHRSKHVSPYRARREEANHETDGLDGSARKRNQRTPTKRLYSEEKGAQLQPQKGSSMNERSRKEFQEVSQASERSSHNRSRSMSAPKPRAKEWEQQVSSSTAAPGAERKPSPLAMTMVHTENDGAYAENDIQDDINERIANMKLSKSPSADAVMTQSTESSLGDIFISRDCTTQLKGSMIKNSGKGNKPSQQFKMFPENNNVVPPFSRGPERFNQNPHGVSISTVLSQTNTSTSSAFGQLSTGQSSTYSGKLSNGKLSGSFKKFTAIRQRSQSDTWLSCVRKGGSCTKSKSPDSGAIDEASFIERALVVEELRLFWADKHSPPSLSKFICQKQQAQHLKQMISYNNCPHILFKGPPGSGKKSLSMALLHEIFGDSWKTSDELRHFHVQETRSMQITVPLTSSPHHVELNLKSESRNARYALMALVKEITGDRELTPEVSDVSFKPDYKVIILYDVDKVADNIQHLIKWIIDRYTDAFKIILCCEDDADILEAVKTRCKLVTVDAPVTHEIIEVLMHIAKKESFELSMSFAARIARKSKQNLRRAIMALEACRAHNYPFVDEQPIPLGWEEVVVEVAEEILSDPSSKRLFLVRGKFQRLLVEFVHPKLILQKLVEQFLKRVEASIKRELYYWHAYYDKRLPNGTSALLKLEEFVAKFMSIYRKSSSSGLLYV